MRCLCEHDTLLEFIKLNLLQAQTKTIENTVVFCLRAYPAPPITTFTLAAIRRSRRVRLVKEATPKIIRRGVDQCRVPSPLKGKTHTRRCAAL